MEIEKTKTEESSTSAALDTLTTEQRASWLKTGELPAPPPDSEEKAASDKPNDGESATPASPKEAESASADEPADETAPDSEAGKQKGREAQRRIRELHAKTKTLEEDNKGLKDRLAALELKKPEPKEEKAARPNPKDEKYLNSPTGFEDFTADLARYEANDTVEKRLEAARKDEEKARTQSEVDKKNKELEDGWRKQCVDAAKKHPDFNEIALDESLPVYAGSQADLFILRSKYGAEVLYYLATHRDKLDEINAMTDTIDQARELFAIERTLTTVPPKKVSSAPNPPAELGGRKTPPEDPEASAINRGDFTAFQKAANAKEVAQAPQRR